MSFPGKAENFPRYSLLAGGMLAECLRVMAQLSQCFTRFRFCWLHYLGHQTMYINIDRSVAVSAAVSHHPRTREPSRIRPYPCVSLLPAEQPPGRAADLGLLRDRGGDGLQTDHVIGASIAFELRGAYTTLAYCVMRSRS